jgi:hypothetical protein
MRPRVAERVAAVLVVLGCGRSGLELDDLELAEARAGTGGTSLPAGGGGVSGGGAPAGGGAVARGGTGGSLQRCDVSFSQNGPVDSDISTLTDVSVGFVCVTEGEVDPSMISIVLESALGRVDGSLSWDAAAGRLTFTPGSPLALATEYTATASHPGATLTWSFRTTDGEWQPAEEVGTGGDLALAVAPDGHGIIAYHTAAELRLRRFTLQGGFSDRGDANVGVNVTPRSLRVGVANGGDALALWGEEGFGSVRVSHGALDFGFDAPRDVSPSGAGRLVEDFALAEDGTGLLLTSFHGRPNEAPTLEGFVVVPQGFGPPMSLAGPMELDTVRALAGPGGRSWAVWSSWGDTGRVFGRHRAGPSARGTLLVMREPAARAGFAAMGPDGSAFVIWEEGSPLDSVKAARFTPGGDGEPPFSLDTTSPEGKTSGIYARIAVDARGRALALWVNQTQTDAGTLEGIRAQRFDFNWAPGSAPLSTITVGEWAVISPMGLALDPHGNGFAAFGHRAPARAVVARFLEATAWQSPIEVAESATAPLVAVDASGRAALAWASGGKAFLRRFIELTAPRPRH